MLISVNFWTEVLRHKSYTGNEVLSADNGCANSYVHGRHDTDLSQQLFGRKNYRDRDSNTETLEVRLGCYISVLLSHGKIEPGWPATGIFSRRKCKNGNLTQLCRGHFLKMRSWACTTSRNGLNWTKCDYHCVKTKVLLGKERMLVDRELPSWRFRIPCKKCLIYSTTDVGGEHTRAENASTCRSNSVSVSEMGGTSQNVWTDPVWVYGTPISCFILIADQTMTSKIRG